MRIFYSAIILLLFSIAFCAGAENFSSQEGLMRVYGENFAGANLEDFIIVEGSSLSTAEVAAIEYVKSQYPEFAQYYAPFKDTPETMQAIRNAPSNKIIVLVGGPGQNKISEQIISLGWVEEESKATYYTQLIVQNGTNPNGAKIFVLSDNKGYSNLPKKGVEYSPLLSVLPPQYVPPAAAGISVLLLHLMNMGQVLVENAIADFGKKKKKVKKKKKESKTFSYAFEIISFVLASLILAIAITWTFAGPTWSFIPLFFINMFVCLFLSISHEGIHWLLAKLFKIPSQYVFWPAGAFMTILSSFFGNPLGLSGLMIEEEEKVKERWRLGVMKLAAPVFSILIALFFFIMNFIFPWEIFQMVFSASSTIAMVDILPVGSLDGNGIRKWNFFAWLLAFLFIGGIYTVITFLII